MERHYTTTPFGRRPMTLGMMAAQVAARAVDKDATVHKWHVFQHVREARDAVGATDRALAILNALLSFHPDTAFNGDSDLIVFPSNEQLISRANGMSPATLRRHLAVLVQCGLVIRRDSPNGKRFARKGPSGEIEQAYGFDLAPMVVRAQEFKELAEAVVAERRALKLAKERITLCRRDIVKMIATGIDEAIPADWRGFQRAYEGIAGRIPRTAPRQSYDAIAGELEALWLEVQNTLETFVNSHNRNANESHSERHIQNSNPDSNTEIEQGSGKEQETSASAAETDNVRHLPRRELPLGIVLDACPDIVALAKGGEIRTWRDLMAAAATGRAYLGISPSAYQEACEVMGEDQAATVIAAIQQRFEHISSPGGYLRSLTTRARDGKFSVWPMIMALLRAKLEKRKQLL